MPKAGRALFIIGIAALCGGLGLGLSGAATDKALAQPAGDAFRGRTITLFVGYPPGGGYDFYGRLIATHLGRHIPGQPTVIVQNMPGAGSISAANHVFNVTPKDGTALGLITQGVAQEEVLGTPGVRYKSAEFTWIGRATSSVYVTVGWHTSKTKTIYDAMKQDILLSSNLLADVLPTVLNNVVGTRFKMVRGYPGSNEGMLAMEREETESAVTSWNAVKTTKKNWLDERKINILVQYGPQRVKDLPDVPSMVELGKTEQDKQVLGFFASSAEIGIAIMAPPGVPAERVQILRAAFDATMKDPQFLADIEARKVEFDRPINGAELQKIVAEAAGVTEDVRARALQARGRAEK
jgi:tripartite-type tricarboxylate transporter receptor subunit TctC